MEKLQTLLMAVLPESSRLLIALQVGVILLLALVAGATFGIWRGYHPGGYSASTFLQTHQGAVRGLNVLLPAMAFAAILLTAILALRCDRSQSAFPLYLLAIGLMVGAGIVTRVFNQAINAEIMTWTPATIPADWSDIRDRWWFWHVVRTFLSAAALITLVTAALTNRGN